MKWINISIIAMCFFPRITYGQCDPAGVIETTTPAPPYSSFALRRHLSLIDSTAQFSNVDAVVIGDSIVQLWPDSLLQKAMSAPLVVNLGVGSDRIQNTLWRLKTGHFDHIRPSIVLVSVGTNNIGSDSACSISIGYRVLISEIRRSLRPDSIVIIKILQRRKNPMELERLKANSEIQALVDGASKLFVITLEARGDDFYGPDGLHPTPHGYAELTEQLQKQLPLMLLR